MCNDGEGGLKVRSRLVVLALAAGALIGGSSAVSAPAHDAPTGAKLVPTKITVNMGEFYFRFSKRTVTIPRPSARIVVVFTAVNKGRLQHDLSFPTLGKKTAILDAGERQALRITFKKKRRYTYVCTLPRHANAGMRGVFIVK